MSFRVVLGTMLLSACAPLVATAQTTKLDENLTQAVSHGCGATQPVIIRTVPGYRTTLRAALAAHGDVIKAEHQSIDALSVTLHCADLPVLDASSSIISISSDAPVASDGGPPAAAKQMAAALDRRARTDQEKARRGLQKEQEGLRAAAAQQHFFDTLGIRRGLQPPAPSCPRAARRVGNALGRRRRPARRQPSRDARRRRRRRARAWASRSSTRASSRAATSGRASRISTTSRRARRCARPRRTTTTATARTSPASSRSRFVGVAPNARLVGLKVLDKKGQGTTSNVLRALEFATTYKDALGISVINLSLGHPIFEPAATDPLVQAVEQAVRAGLVVVVSAGNFGINPATGLPGYAGLASPGNAPSALTVAALKTFDTVTRLDDRIADYSSRGPTWYDGFAKPDLAVPGDSLLSVAAAGSTLRAMNEARGGSGDYMRLSGTSMAAGVASGIAALMLDANHGLTPNALKAALEFSAIPVEDDQRQPLRRADRGRRRGQRRGRARSRARHRHDAAGRRALAHRRACRWSPTSAARRCAGRRTWSGARTSRAAPASSTRTAPRGR